MNTITKRIEIDFYSPTSYEVIKVQQGDHNAREIELILYDQGKPYEITDNITLQFTGYRGNGSAFFKNNCVSAKGNCITVTLTNDILYYAGTINAKIVLYDTPNRCVLSTVPFQIVCEKTPCHESSLTQNEKSIITDLIFQVEEFSESAAETIRKSEENAEAAAESASAAADSAEAAKNSEEAAEASKNFAAESSANAAASANTASVKAEESANSAKTARSYTCGDTDLRPNESTDNAKYYYTQSKEIYDDFTQAGSVVGVKGNAQTEYQSGFVNLTAEDIGALPNTAGATINSAYSQANAAYDRANISYNSLNSDSLCLGNNAKYPGFMTTAVGGNACAIGNCATAYGCAANAAGYDSTALGYGAFTDPNASSSTAVGVHANALGNYSIAIGSCAYASGNDSTALGSNANASSVSSTALGGKTNANINSTALGYYANASGNSSTALGHGASASSNYSIAIGYYANASKNYSTALGHEARAISNYSIALGNYAIANGSSSTALGSSAESRGSSSTALGHGANASGNYSMALGHYANVSGNYSIALGSSANATSLNSTALGCSAKANSSNSTALGYYAKASGVNSTAIGYNATVSAPNTIQLGDPNTSKICGYVTFTLTSDERDKADITNIEDSAVDFLNKIHAIRYFRNQREFYIDNENLSDEEQAKKSKFGLCEYDREAHAKGTKKGSRVRVGVRAQEVLKALEETYGDSSYGNLVDDNFFDLNPEDIPEGVENQLTVNYTGFIPFLIKAVQELSKQTNENTAAIHALTAQNQSEEETKNE